MASIYQRIRDRNRCAHRDFQNIGVNGCRTTSMKPPGVITGLQSDPDNDHPKLVFFALIGNDVCNGHPGSSHMTTPAEFHESVTASLQYLEAKLPRNSTVVFFPLVDGRVLWDTMHDQTHPIGVPYPNVYEFLSCNDANPCWGWLNSNATVSVCRCCSFCHSVVHFGCRLIAVFGQWRNFTSARAAELNKVYEQIISEQSYTSFSMVYEPINWQEYIRSYVAQGGVATDLIEPVDGFHPSQSSHQLIARNVWSKLLINAASGVGGVNPNNNAIGSHFGDQGGYGY